MKARILLILFLLIPAIPIHAQSDILAKKVKIDITDGTVGDILKEIGDKGGFSFSYNQDIPKYQNVSLSHSKQTVQQFLDEIFKQEIYCIEYGDRLIIMPKPQVEIEYTISGRVVDAETKQPVVGTTVFIPGSEPLIGSVSDKDGYFKIQIPADQYVIKLTSIGYKSTIVNPDKSAKLEIELIPDNQVLDEVKIVQYVKPKAENKNSAISIIPAERLKNIQHGNIENALQGNTSGVHVVRNSGMPGASLQVKVRGMNSLINSDPVYYLDGIPVQHVALHAISPHDIESVEVIKDGAGLSKYGITAANGVVLLHSIMKDAKKTTIRFDYNFGIQTVWKKLDLMSKSEYMDFLEEMKPSNYTSVKLYDSLLEATEYQDIVFHPAKTTDYFFSAHTGNKKSNYYISSGYYKQEAVIGELEFERYSFKAKSEHKINPRIDLGIDLSLAYIQYKGLKEGCFLNDYNNPITAIIGMRPFAVDSSISGRFGNSRTITDTQDDVELTKNLRQNYSLFSRFFTRVNLLPGLNYISKIGIGIYYQDNVSFNRGNVPESSLDITYTIHENLYNIIDFNYNWAHSLSYYKNLHDKHDLNISLEFEFGQNKNKWIPLELNEYDKDLTQLESNQLEFNNKTTTDYSFRAYKGFIGYTLEDRYNINFNLRNDVVEFYNQGNKQKIAELYPSVSLGWIFIKENYFKSGILSYGKLRGSWGKAGNSPVINYSYFAKIMRDMEYVYAFENTNYTTRSAAIRQTIELFYVENTNSYNAGLDLGVFKSRLFITLDYFRSYLDIGNKYPFDNPKVHFEKLNHMGSYGINHLELSQIENNGMDLEISYKHSRQDYTGNLGLNFSVFNNKIIDIKEEDTDPLNRDDIQPITVNIPGETAFSFYGYKIERLFKTEDCDEEGNAIKQPFNKDETTGEIIYAQPGAKAGDYKFADLNGDNIIDSKDRTIIGNPLPDFTFGLFYDAQFKNFDLSVLFQGSYGNEIFKATKLWLYNPYTLTNWSRDIVNGYKEPLYDDEGILTDPGNTETSLHRFDPLNENNNLRVSDFYIEDGSYLRLKNIQLGYTFKPDLTRRIHIRKLRIYLGAHNLFTITNYTGMDPEVGGWGIDSGIYPQPRTYMGGVNIEF